jgi:hypothetical protein
MSGSEPVPFTPVEPTVVAEVEVDSALGGPFGRIRHRCRHVRVRLDLHRNHVDGGGDDQAAESRPHLWGPRDFGGLGIGATATAARLQGRLILITGHRD